MAAEREGPSRAAPDEREGDRPSPEALAKIALVFAGIKREKTGLRWRPVPADPPRTKSRRSDAG